MWYMRVTVLFIRTIITVLIISKRDNNIFVCEGAARVWNQALHRRNTA